MFDTSETGRGPWALRPKAPALLRPFFTSFQQTPARDVQRASVWARRFGSTWTAPIVRYAHLRPPCSAFTAAMLCIFGRVCPDRSPGEVPVELSVRAGCPAIADLLGMSAAVAGPGLQLPPGRSWLLLSWPLCLFALQVQIMDASLDNFSISRNPTRMEHHSVDMSGIWVSFKVALVGWTHVFDAAFGQHVRYSMTPKCWRCTVFSSVHAVPSNLEACLVLRTDHIPV